MPPTLADTTLVYFLGQAPTSETDQDGRHNAGPSGQLLRGCLLDGEEDDCSFDYVVRDRTPGDRAPTWNEIECCRGLVTASIEKAKPKVIVGLGVAPLQWAISSADINGMRGRMFAIKVGTHECWFLPTFDPALIYKTAYDKRNPLRSKLGHCFKMDIRKALGACHGLERPQIHTELEARKDVACFPGPDNLGSLLNLLESATKALPLGIDIETSTLRPYAATGRVLTCAISLDGASAFSFAVDHPKAKWSVEQRNQILTALHKLIKGDVVKIAHNAPFELEWFMKLYGPTVVNHDVWECTMMQAHFLDERRGKQAYGSSDEGSRRATYQSLDFLCKQHFGIAYKKFFKLPKADMASADLAETLVYNGVDAKYAKLLFERQKLLLRGEGLQDAYYEALPRQPTVALMQHLGIDVDQSEILVSQKLLGKEIQDIEQSILAQKVVQNYIANKGQFNPLSSIDTVAIFRDYLKCEEVVVKDEKGKERISTDKGVLDKIDHPLAQLIVELRNRTKLKSTYVDCFEQGKGNFMWPDGKLHTSFNTTFTVTGRTSSDEPNQQNWPKRNDSWVRKTVVPSKNSLLVAFDYGQLEACTAAMCSKDKVLVQALWDDYDIHMEWTERLVKRCPSFLAASDSLDDPKVRRRYRSLVKNKMVFPAIFGASTESIAGYLNAPVAEIDELMEDFWNTFTGLKNWQNKLMKSYYDKGYVTSLTGRRHKYPLTRNEAINFPVQGVASDIVCQTMNALSYEAVQTRQWHLHPILNIHDDLTFVIPDSEEVLESAIRRIYEVMLTPAYDFINVPLSVECSVGHNWYEMQDVGKFWSHRDL